MRARSLALIVLAVLLAGGTALLARAWLAAQKTQPAAAAPLALPPPQKSVLVAHLGISRGQILKPEDFAWQAWPKDGIDKTYIVTGTRAPQSFNGWVARGPIAEGEPITLAEIVAPGDRGFLAAVLRPGMRAVSVPITATSGISGFVFPGDRVDVLITQTLPPTKADADTGGESFQHKAAETILHDVRVVGVDQQTEIMAGKAFVAHTATLEVTPKQTEIIALADEMGRLSLSLRSLATAPSQPSGLIAASAEMPAASTAMPAASTAMPAASAAMPAASAEAPGDSINHGDHATYTLDSDVSPLLPKAFNRKPDPHLGVVTILRGDSKTEEVKVSQPASRGS